MLPRDSTGPYAISCHHISVDTTQADSQSIGDINKTGKPEEEDQKVTATAEAEQGKSETATARRALQNVSGDATGSMNRANPSETNDTVNNNEPQRRQSTETAAAMSRKKPRVDSSGKENSSDLGTEANVAENTTSEDLKSTKCGRKQG